MKHSVSSFKVLFASFCLSLPALSSQPFQLSDSGPAAPDFRERFLGTYGINADIEPRITPADRPLYEKVAPFIRTDPARAVREVEAGMDEDSSPAFDFLLGNLLYQLGRNEAAERALNKAIERFPDFRRAYRTLGFIQIQSGDFSASVDTWLKVISLGGGDGQSYGMLAYAYLVLNKYQSALSAYEMARVFNPDSMDFRRGQAQCLLALGRNNEAAALLDELIMDDPEKTDFWLLQANVFLGQEQYDDAIANLEILHGKGGANRDALGLLANLHLRSGNHELALRAYESVLKEHGFDTMENALRPLDYLVRRGLFPEAASYLQTLEGVLPEQLGEDETIRLSIARAGLSMERGDLAAAIERLEPIVTAFPLSGDALLMIAEAHRRDQNFEEAEFYLERAYSLPDEKYEALVGLGRLRVDQGDFKRALESLREAEFMRSSPSLVRYIEAIEAAR
jgi:tetratricopeptide (TPR) repeat protein